MIGGQWSEGEEGCRHDFGEAEVGDFDGAGLGEEDVFRLDIAVDDAAVVGVRQAASQDLRDDGEGGVGIEARGGEELAWRERPSINSMERKEDRGG